MESSALRRNYHRRKYRSHFTVQGFWPEGPGSSLQEWLSDLRGEWGFRIDDPWVFCYITPQATNAKRMTDLLEMLDSFIERLPQPANQPESGAGAQAAR